jgi:hypothetical protein
MPRQDTRWESEGAEFLTLGNLLLEKIPTYKTYTNMPGYDLVATNPELNTSAKIQVKSRWKTGANGFLIKNFDCDFVVIVKLNRGSQDGRIAPSAPEFYVIPARILAEVPRTENWNKITFSSIPDMESYKNKWSQISECLIEAAKWETILHIAGEGGGYEIRGTNISGVWKFRLELNSIWSGYSNSAVVSSYKQTIELLDTHDENWTNLQPVIVHKDFCKLIYNDVAERKCMEKENFERWVKACSF